MVVDREGVPVGIVTDRDLAVRCVADSMPTTTRVDTVMTRPVTRVHESTPIEDAVRTMAAAGIRRLAVEDDAGGLVGLLTMDDVLDLLVEEAVGISRILHRQAPA